MSIYYGPTCTCGAWNSVTPPPPCPIHSFQYRAVIHTSTINTRCKGRHCAHSTACGTYDLWNGTNG